MYQLYGQSSKYCNSSQTLASVLVLREEARIIEKNGRVDQLPKHILHNCQIYQRVRRPAIQAVQIIHNQYDHQVNSRQGVEPKFFCLYRIHRGSF